MLGANSTKSSTPSRVANGINIRLTKKCYTCKTFWEVCQTKDVHVCIQLHCHSCIIKYIWKQATTTHYSVMHVYKPRYCILNILSRLYMCVLYPIDVITHMFLFTCFDFGRWAWLVMFIQLISVIVIDNIINAIKICVCRNTKGDYKPISSKWLKLTYYPL